MAVYRVKVHNPFRVGSVWAYIAVGIRKATGKYYNHAGLKLYCEGEWYMYHAVWPKVKKVPYEAWAANDPLRIVKLEPVQPEELDRKGIDEAEVLKRAEAYVGSWYDVLSLFVWQPISMATGIWLGKKGKAASKNPYCYEMMEECLGTEEAYKALPTE